VIEPIDMNEVATEVIALAFTDIQRARVTVTSDFGAGLPRVAGARVQLQQVIMNLLRNAIEATSVVKDRQGRILIRTEASGATVQLIVEDTGVGFGADGTERIFDAFYTTKPDGMGIGLSVSRSIIESHSGRLWAESNAVHGATVGFSIPNYRANRSAEASDTTSPTLTV
jgi:signal transduction histidine kinase